jgi:hypothetical protein
MRQPVPTPVFSISPVVLPDPGRATDLQVRISAPVTGSSLPIILLSHGLGFSNHLSSLNGYAPLANHWAAQGFAVIQPTHLDSRTLSHNPAVNPGRSYHPRHWRTRAEDMHRILDQLDVIEAAVPQLAGRLNPDKVAVAGHSMADPRITAGVLLAATGRGGDAVTPYVAENYPFLTTTDFSAMAAPALVVAGDKDDSAFLTVAGPDWHADPYHLAPGPKSLLTLYGAEHGLGGVSGYDVAETTDENPDRVATIARLTSSYLRSQLYPDDPAWQTACDAWTADPEAPGRIDVK